MNERGLILAVVCFGIAMVGAVNTVYQLHRMVELDAMARGLKHPKFWGFFTMFSKSSSGLLMYLIGRRKYPILNMTEESRVEIRTRKKKAGVGLIFAAIAAIGLIISVTLL